ncbi:hypothetical protein BSAF29S_06281 [Bacillus safensis subsp. safensis]
MYILYLFILFGAIAALMVSGAFQDLDNQIILWFESIRLPFLNDVMLALTDLGISALLVPIMLIFSVVLFMYKRYYSILMRLLLCLTEKRINHALQELFARERPAFDLVVGETYYCFSEDIEKRYIRKEAAEALEKLFKGAKKENFELAAVSGYRSYDRQKVIFDSEVKLKGKEKAQEAVALPGESEHQTGLAMDISSKSAGFEISEKFGETPDGKWVAKNAYKYGFIIRYPKGKEDITKYEYEPWHLRYVGKEAAKAMHDHDLTFEEYMNKVKKI